MPGGRPSKIHDRVDGLAGFRQLLEEGCHPVTAAGAAGADEETWRAWCADDADLADLAQRTADWWFDFFAEHRRQTSDYRAWRTAVFERDDYTCQRCGAGRDVHAHHREPWASAPDLRFDVDNGETLCVGCHADEHPEYAHLILASGRRHRG